MPWHRTFAVVTGGSLVGLCLGGGFGWGAGSLAPGLFEEFAHSSLQAPGVACVLGAFGGVFLGGGLGCAAVAMEVITRLKLGRS